MRKVLMSYFKKDGLIISLEELFFFFSFEVGLQTLCIIMPSKFLFSLWIKLPEHILFSIIAYTRYCIWFSI